MKKNGNDKKQGEYYLGLDVGTNSVGWAVTDNQYNLKKCNGKQMWGARLFSEANSAEDRRTARSARRRLERRKTRLNQLELLLNNDICKIDPTFFRRLKESDLWLEDKTDKNCRYSLFNDKGFTDKDYHREYPTPYHLRSELAHTDQPHDYRLVFLAIHHLLKSRGHFLYEGQGNDDTKKLPEAFSDFIAVLDGNNIAFHPENQSKFLDELTKTETITHKKENLRTAYGTIEKNDTEDIDLTSLVDLLSGTSITLSKLFPTTSFNDAEITKIKLDDDLEANHDTLATELGNYIDIIDAAKEVYDIARLDVILNGKDYISDAKKDLFNKNKTDLAILKNYVQNNYPDEYNNIFTANEKIKNNLAAYNQYKLQGKNIPLCSQEDFCKFLAKKLPNMKTSENEEERRIFSEIENKTFLTKLRGTSNGLIPYQVNLKELKAILNNASTYWTTLNQIDEDGISIKDKIISLFTFRIPYYVGPLNKKSKTGWIERTDEKITPWNFDRVVDKTESAKQFMVNLIGKCTYTLEPVLPMNSLLYSEFMVLNTINKITVDGTPIPVETKKKLYNDLFEESKAKVTKKTILKWLMANGLAKEDSIVSGIDDEIKVNLRSYHDFKEILYRTHDKEMVEDIIEHVCVLGNDKKMLKDYLEKNTHDLTPQDYKKILRLNYKDWGRLSRYFLIGIEDINKETGEVQNIISMLRDTNLNLMELLSSNYKYAQLAQEHRVEKGQADTIHKRLDELYIAPAVRRSIWQTMRIVDEIVDIEQGQPKKIFIEMARTSSKELKNKRTESRKEKLQKLYASCKEQQRELFDKLQGESDESLRRDKLYLYYTQFGKCMYSGHTIDLESLNSTTYDIDHIFPQSKVMDDSIDNRVLVESVENRRKSDTYPLSDVDENIQKNMKDFWQMLRDKGLISKIKYERLIRKNPLTEAELSAFVQRQLTETQQSTKALAQVLHETYPNAEIVYSKAMNVSRFRQQYQIPKFRDINDQHHAKDAYLNIVVGNVFNTKFTKKFFKNIQYEEYSLKHVFDYNTPTAWVAPTKDEIQTYYKDPEHKGDYTLLSGSFKTIYKYVFKNSPIITCMPYQTKGALFDLQLMPKGKGQLEIKKSKDINKYGGYNKISGAYFCVVEHTEKKKRVRTIKPVYVYNEKEYEKDPIKYCKEVLHLEEPVIIQKKILNSATFEIYGARVVITGRTSKQLCAKHQYQFACSIEDAQYLKNISKYVDRCAQYKKELKITKYDHITEEQNFKLYCSFSERLNSSIYNKVFSFFAKDIDANKQRFKELDMLSQCKILLEILKAFKCDSTNTNLELLNGKKATGIILYNSKISAYDSAYLINQSVTGLYETKIDLLQGFKK